jgi:putative SOS response-associated peptidase YedK
MCGRYTLAETQGIAARFNVASVPATLAPRYNIAPTQSLPVIIKQSPNQIVLMQWGLVPHWAKAGKGDYAMINARAETLAQKPTFRKLLSFHRCLVPASGFYEWQASANGKTPHYIHLKDEPLFAFAGLYERTKDDQGHELLTYTIITTAPNSLMAGIHNRMPVILPQEAEETWLNPDETEADRLTPLLQPYPAEAMLAVPVSRAVNNVRNDTPALVQPMAGA